MNVRVSCPWIDGRDRELQILQRSYDAALDGEPTAVLVGGEVGIGKTRLVQEFADRVGAAGAQLLAGCCLPVAEFGPPYAPVAQALRSVLRNRHGDDLVALLGDERADIARLLPEYRPPGSAKPDRPLQTSPQPQLFDVVCRLLERLAHRAPVVLIVEDLHWADRSTLDLLMHLRHRLTHAPLLMIVTYRSDETAVERLRSWLATVGRSLQVARVELGALPTGQVEEQATGILGAAPHRPAMDALVARADGNPFFVAELLAGPDLDGGLPIAVRELLGERITALPKDAQRLVRIASAAGQARSPNSYYTRWRACPTTGSTSRWARPSGATSSNRPNRTAGCSSATSCYVKAHTSPSCPANAPEPTQQSPPSSHPAKTNEIGSPTTSAPSWPTIGRQRASPRRRYANSSRQVCPPGKPSASSKPETISAAA